MRILGLDTSLAGCGAAVMVGDAVLAAASEPMARGHQERLGPMVREVMARAGLAFADLDRVAVTVGPGSFTGLRVGLAFAKGLGLALARPVVGVGTLEALAQSENGEGCRIAVIDAGRGRLFAQAFSRERALGPPANLAVDEAPAWLETFGPSADRPRSVIGPGARLLSGVVRADHLVETAFPRPEAVCRLSRRADGRPASPLYLRAPDAIPMTAR